MRFYQIINLFEVNVNKKDVAEKILLFPIQCGFEAEVIWPDLDLDGDIKNLTWDDAKQSLDRNELRLVYDHFEQWITETSRIDDYFDEANNKIIFREYNDNSNMRAFLSSNELDDEFKKSELFIDGFIDQHYSAYTDYILDVYSDDIFDVALELAVNDITIDDWISDQFADVYDMLATVGLQHIPNNYEEAGFEKVANIVRTKLGGKVLASTQHGANAGSTSPDFWRIEPDATISPGSDFGTEIVSPVYENISEMIKDIEQLFNLLAEYNVYVNNSTGFHITMSINSPMPRKDINQVKIATLLSDVYLLKKFNRLKNSFTKSQQVELQKLISNSKNNIDMHDSLETIENNLKKAISLDKYYSIHFKTERNKANNQLIEFRIIGGDYISSLDVIKRSALKYGAVMLAGYDDTMFRDQYIKSLSKMISRWTDPVANPYLGTTELPNTAFVNGVRKFIKVFNSKRLSPEIERIKSSLHYVYNNDEFYPRNQKEEFFYLITRLAEMLIIDKDAIVPSSALFGIRQGFKELDVTYADYYNYVNRASIGTQYLRDGKWDDLMSAVKRLLGK